MDCIIFHVYVAIYFVFLYIKQIVAIVPVELHTCVEYMINSRLFLFGVY